MDYLQGVVEDYLSAGQGMFINPECLIQLDADGPKKERHWYCDIVAVDLKENAVFLCEVTYARQPTALFKRLRQWNENWSKVREALRRDYGIPAAWKIQPQLFVLEVRMADVSSKVRADIAASGSPCPMPEPAIVSLDQVARWRLESLESRPTGPDD